MARGELTAQQARVILRDELAVTEAKRALEQAKAKRKETRERYLDRIPIGELIEVGGVRIKRGWKTTGLSFRLTAYLAKHKLTKAMEPFVGQPTSYVDWQVSEVEDR